MSKYVRVFTDEDLRILKEEMARCGADGGGFSPYELEPILARLEAAEELAQEAMCHCKYNCDECGEMKNAWKKSKGVSK